MGLFDKIFRRKKKETPVKPEPEPQLYGRVGTKAQPKATISARIIRADGKVENLGRLK